MPHYTSITIIYNPKSTGPGKRLAHKLEAELRANMTEPAISLLPTEYPGHAEDLAYKIAKASGQPLVISASGDGGYNEVVNGLIKAQHEGAKPVAGLLPAGNANDHFRNLHDGDLVEAVLKGKEHRIDLLKLKATARGRPYTRYAHSYIGFGLTPKVGHELNKTSLNRLNEKWIVLKVVFRLRPMSLVVNGEDHIFDSLIFSNVGKMSKVLTLSGDSALNDGKFEVAAFYHRNKFKLIMSLIRASTVGLNEVKQMDKFSFETREPALVQLDGEITTIDGGSKTTISVERTILRCIV